MRVPILIVFMLVTGIAVAALSAAAGHGIGGIVLRVILAMIFIQVVYFIALLAFSALAGRSRNRKQDIPSASLKRR